MECNHDCLHCALPDCNETRKRKELTPEQKQRRKDSPSLNRKRKQHPKQMRKMLLQCRNSFVWNCKEVLV